MMKTWAYTVMALFLLTISGQTQVLAPEQLAPDVESFDESTWNDLVSDADYFRDRQKDKDKGSAPVKNKGLKELSLGPLKYVLLAAIVLLIAFILIRVFASELFLKPGKVDPAAEISLADLEQQLDSAPLQAYLAPLVRSGKYSAAIRVYYLMVLRALHSAGLIKWHRDKTNSHYLREMEEHISYELFRELTAVFESAWYSDIGEISRPEFERLEPSFRKMLQAIDHPPDRFER
jgi:hypothetical protein